jgi:hypothetical protein
MSLGEILSRAGVIFGILFKFWWAWLPLVLFFIALELWLRYKEEKYFNNWTWVHLEVNLPRVAERPFKAMEQVFAGFHGLRYSEVKFKDKLFKDRALQEWLACEIVSLGGNIHFYIHAPEQFRNLVEAQIYGQFTDAEIKEAQDYLDMMPKDIINSNYDLFGAELKLAEADAIPIRTYPYFEGPKTELTVDPLSGVLESFGQLKEGEQAWLQILTRPAGSGWKKEGEKLVAKIMGREEKTKSGLGEGMIEGAFTGLFDVLEEVFGQGAVGGGSATTPEKPKGKIVLSPGEKEIAESIERNMSKFGFEIAMRLVYLGEKDKFNKNAFNTLAAPFRQFSTQDLNRFTAEKKSLTSGKFPFKEKRTKNRKKKLYLCYRTRNFRRKFKPFVFTTEELATVYHFPTVTIEAPLVPRLEAKKGEPPGSLPVS